MAEISRRTFLGTALGLGAGAAATTLLAGCGDTSTPSADTAKGVALPSYQPYTGVSADFPALPNGTPAGFRNYPATPTSATTRPPGDGKPITGIAQLNGPVPPALNNNPFWQELNKRVGSPMQIQEVNAGSDFVAKIATIQASGQLPDLMQLSPAVPSLSEFVRAKILDLSPYLAGDKIKDYPFLANIPTQFWKAGVYAGRLAGVPIPRGAPSSRVMFYRADVLDKLGVTATISSYQDFADLLAEVTDARANRWGLASSPLDYIRQMYSIPNNFLQNTDGTFSCAYEDPHQKDALEAARKLREKGLINPDMAAATPGQRNQWFISGIGLFNWSTYTGWPGASGSITPTQAGTRIGLLQVPGFTGGQGRGWLGSLTNNMVSVPESAKDRATTLLAVINWLAAPFGTAEYLFQRYGIEGVHYTLNGTNPSPIANKAGELALGINYLGSGPYVLYNTQDPTYVQTVYTHMSTYLNNVAVDATQLFYSPTFGSKGAQLTSAIQAVELDIIYGRKPVSAWDAAVKDYLDRGGTATKEELAEAAKNS